MFLNLFITSAAGSPRRYLKPHIHGMCFYEYYDYNPSMIPPTKTSLIQRNSLGEGHLFI